MKLVKNAIIAVAILAVGVMGFKRLKSMATKEEIKESASVMDVRVMDVLPDTVELPLTVYGKLNAINRVDLLAEVSGTFVGGDRPFLEGTSFRKGEVMIQLDNAEAKANVMSLKGNFINALLAVLPDIKVDYPGQFSAFESYYNELTLSKPLPALPTAEGKLEKFLIARGIPSSYYQVKSAEERLEKFSIRAPFDGTLAQAAVKKGNLVSPGRALGSFVGTGGFEMRSAVTLAYSDQLSEGQQIRFTSPDVDGAWTGKIDRISPVVDNATQSVNIISTVNGEQLREGMYLTGTIQNMMIYDALKVPAHMVFDNGFVYTVEQDSILQKTPVKVVEWLDNEIIIKGLKNGQLLVNEPTLKAASGLVVNPVK